MSHAQIVNVAITRQTTAVSRAGFGVPMFLATHKRFHDRIQYFTDLAGVTSAGFVSTDPAYVAAAAMFSQNPGPVQIAIGTRHANDSVITVATVANSTAYTVTITAATGTTTAFTYTSDISATALEIAAGLTALIPGASGLPVSAVDNLNGTFTISSNPALSLYSVALTSNLTLGALTASETPEAAAAAIVLVSNDWYGLAQQSHTQAEVVSLAVWVEANKKLYLTSTNDANVINTTDVADTTTVAAVLKAAAYDRTGVIYNADPTKYIEAAMFGKLLPTDPGSETWAFKTLAGVTRDILTTTQSKNAHDKHCNTYEEIGGVNITFEGWVASGEYLDVIRGIDWLESEMEANIYSRLVNLPKIPYTDAGLTVIEAEIRRALDAAVAVGLLAVSPEYTVTVPAVSSISAGDKATRTLNGVTFLATLAGAIHKVNVAGVVTL